MEIVHIRSSNGFYGAESVLVTLIAQMNQCGINSTLLVLNNHKTPNKDLYVRALERGINAKLVDCKRRLDWETVKEITGLVMSKRKAIIHTHDVKTNVYGYLVKRRTGASVVTTLHGWTSDTALLRVYEKLDRWVIGRFDRLISVSETINDRVSARLLSKLVCIPNGVDNAVFTPHEKGFGKRNWGIPEDHFVFGIIARLTVEKGHRLLLEAFSTIVADYPKTSLLIIGDGPEQGALKKRGQELKISGNVVFGGSCAEIPRAFHDIDCYVSASFTEGMPMVILESMASGVPIIGTSVGSLPELLSGGAGILVQTGQCEQLANAMKSFLAGQFDQESMVALARKRVEEEYNSKIQAERYLRIYYELFGHSGSAHEV